MTTFGDAQTEVLLKTFCSLAREYSCTKMKQSGWYIRLEIYLSLNVTRWAGLHLLNLHFLSELRCLNRTQDATFLQPHRICLVKAKLLYRVPFSRERFLLSYKKGKIKQTTFLFKSTPAQALPFFLLEIPVMHFPVLKPLILHLRSWKTRTPYPKQNRKRSCNRTP